MVMKKVLKKVGRAIRRRYLPKGKKGKTSWGKGLKNLAKDVMVLKSMVNAEKKRFSIFSSDNSQLLGQINVNNSGHYIQDITPLPSQGAGNGQRNGSSIKLHSAMLKIQLQQMSATSSPISGRIYIIKVVGAPVTTAVAAGEFFEPNAWLAAQNPGSVILDTHCQRQQDFYKDYRVIASRRFYIKNDNISNQVMIKDINIPIRFKGHHVKFNGDTQSVTNGQLMALFVADSGNISAGANSTLLGISQTAFLTGLFVRYDYQYYYYDN
nr:capsid protein [Cressdnaviricota sp.]UOF81291.1 capsid protein [Cressdnaviricota sp.]